MCLNVDDSPGVFFLINWTSVTDCPVVGSIVLWPQARKSILWMSRKLEQWIWVWVFGAYLFLLPVWENKWKLELNCLKMKTEASTLHWLPNDCLRQSQLRKEHCVTQEPRVCTQKQWTSSLYRAKRRQWPLLPRQFVVSFLKQFTV